MGPTAGPVCRRLREQLAEWQEWEPERDVEEVQIRAAREEREAAVARERREQDRQEAEADLWEQLRKAFLAANPSAMESDFTRLYPRLRDEHLVREAQRDPVEEEASTLARRFGGGRLL